MKKIVALMTSLVMAASLAACGEEEVVVDDSVNSSVESSVSSEESSVSSVESSVEEGGQDTMEGSFNVLDLPGVEGPDVRNTTWSLAGGCEDGVPLTEERAYAALEAYGGTLQLVFDEEDGVQMVQGGGTLAGTYQTNEDSSVLLTFDNNGSELVYLCVFADIDGLTMIAVPDDTGLNGLYFVEE